MIKKLLVAMLISSTIAYASNSVEININNNTLELAGDYNLNNVYNLNDDAQYAFTLSYLSSEKSDTTQKLVSAGAKIMNPYINDNGISLGIGAQVVWADSTSNSFMAVPLNIFLKFELNEKVNFDVMGAYAPKVLSFADARGYTAFNAKVNYKLLDNGYVYIGKRYIQTRYDINNANVDVEFDDNFFFGYKVLF